MWKGTLRLGDRRVGVKLYAAAASPPGIDLHLLHAEDHVRVRQRMVHPATGETVATEDTLRGVEVERGLFVLLDEAEEKELEPEPTRDVRVAAFVPAGSIDRRWYERPYWLGPDEGERERYFALAQAMQDSGSEGVARWTMRGREQAGALVAHEGRLALVRLRASGEVLPLAGLEAPPGGAPDARELRLARQLVAALATEFDPSRYHDEHATRLRELVEAKAAGRRPPRRTYRPRKVEDESLAEVLERSLKQAG